MPEHGTYCAVCGRVEKWEPGAPVPTVVTVPVMGTDGVNLEVPGVYPLCTRCRRTVAFAERARNDAND